MASKNIQARKHKKIMRRKSNKAKNNNIPDSVIHIFFEALSISDMYIKYGFRNTHTTPKHHNPYNKPFYILPELLDFFIINYQIFSYFYQSICFQTNSQKNNAQQKIITVKIDPDSVIAVVNRESEKN